MKKSEEKNIFLGITTALGAFLFWGFAPIYWKQVQSVSAMELLGHRIIWGFLVLGLILFIRFNFFYIKSILCSGDRWLILSSFLIFINWGLFIWAVNNEMIVDASLGYYLNPLLNIIAGYLFFNERMGPLKIQAILLASIGVGVLFVMNSGNPFVSLALAASFCLYGILKKQSSLRAESALFFEFSFWIIPILILFIYNYSRGSLVFIDLDLSLQAYLFLAGLVTIFPLWLFNTSVKNLDLGTVGFLQFITPSIQLLLGVLLYREIFDSNRLMAFGLIWLGIALYLVESYRKNER